METIGPLQLRVMHFLWKQGPSTVHAVLDHVNSTSGGRPLAYTTILTVMRNLARRNFLNQKPQGRSHVFSPLIDEPSYKMGMVRHMRKDLFASDPCVMLDYLSRDEELDPSQRERIAQLVRDLTPQHA